MSHSALISPPTLERAAAGCLLLRMSRRRAFTAIADHGSALAAWSTPAIHRRGLDPETLMAECERRGVALISYFDGEFPAALRHIPDPPLLLYVRGDAACLSHPSVAVVGARRCSRTGAEFARDLARGLVRSGVTVVSGLARGIDAAAHRGALDGAEHDSNPDSRAGTVAVMGAGLGEIYPRANSGLADAILAAGGALVSEYSPTTPPARHQFPERNRLISGLSQGAVIVEAGERSGSLITARFALEQGREVMAVPGAIAAGLNRGCHRLLRDGAALIESAADVLITLGYISRPVDDGDGVAAPPEVPAALGGILAAMEPVVTTLDELVAATGLTPADVAGKLVELELAGFVQQVAEGYIRRPFSPSP